MCAQTCFSDRLGRFEGVPGPPGRVFPVRNVCLSHLLRCCSDVSSMRSQQKHGKNGTKAHTSFGVSILERTKSSQVLFEVRFALQMCTYVGPAQSRSVLPAILRTLLVRSEEALVSPKSALEGTLPHLRAVMGASRSLPGTPWDLSLIHI